MIDARGHSRFIETRYCRRFASSMANAALGQQPGLLPPPRFAPVGWLTRRARRNAATSSHANRRRGRYSMMSISPPLPDAADIGLPLNDETMPSRRRRYADKKIASVCCRYCS